MSTPRTAPRRGGNGFVSPDGQLWEVPTFPCPVVVLGAEHAEIDGKPVPAGDGTSLPVTHRFRTVLLQHPARPATCTSVSAAGVLL